MPVTRDHECDQSRVSGGDQSGAASARGEYLVLLNNDVVVTDGWLDQLIALANMSAGTRSGRGARLRYPLLTAYSLSLPLRKSPR